MTIGEALRAARSAAGIDLSVMAARTHYSKPYLSMVETGKRAATADVVKAYERVLGIGLGDETTNFVAANITVVTELAASIAGNDPDPLATVQTTHGTDLAIATLADHGTVAHLRRWLKDGDNPILRVNAAARPIETASPRFPDRLRHPAWLPLFVKTSMSAAAT